MRCASSGRVHARPRESLVTRASIPRPKRRDNPRARGAGATIGALARRALSSSISFARLRGLSLLPIFLDETLHVRWSLLISQGDKPWDATWKWGRALTIWLGALVSPWASDLCERIGW